MPAHPVTEIGSCLHDNQNRAWTVEGGQPRKSLPRSCTAAVETFSRLPLLTLDTYQGY